MPIWRGTTNSNWGTASNWLADGSGSGVPTALTDAVFDNLSPACTVNVAGLCRNLNFNSGTGYANTITMTNSITVGSTVAATAASVTLSPTMVVGGSGRITTRTNTSVTLTSNGYVWPNDFGIGTASVGIACSVTFVGNWTINGTLTIGTGGAMQYTFTGAVNITCNGNLFINIVGTQTSNAIRSAGGLTTLILAGNTSWTSAGPVSIGINININAPGNTVTIGNNCSYGGNGTQSTSSFTYTAGTVVTSGTFHFFYFPSGNNYTVNVNGSSSTSATTTNTSGINFDNLSLRTSVTTNVQSCTLSSPICVVNNFSITSFSTTTKGIANLLSNNAYLNGSITINGYSITGTTTFRLQGTGNWSENDTLTAGVTGFGLSNPIVITGNYTLTSVVGIYFGSITYTSGTFTLTGYGLRVLGSTLTGFGSGGILIPTLYHSTASAGVGGAARIILTDTVPVQITNLTFDGFNLNRAFAYAGNIGFIVNNFNYQQTSLVGASATGFALANSVTYVVLNSFIFNAFVASQTSNIMGTTTGAAPDAIFTLAFGASQDVFGMGARTIDSSAGQTIWSRKGLLTSATNWQNWTYPKTRFSSFTS